MREFTEKEKEIIASMFYGGENIEAIRKELRCRDSLLRNYLNNNGFSRSINRTGANLIDLTGCKFGKLTVLHKDESKSSKNAYWVCLCECGTTKSILSKSLRDGNVISCGCKRTKKIERQKEHTINKYLGQSFGNWKVMSLDRIQNKYIKYYWCKCSCGTIKSVEIGSLTQGKSKSCGCMPKNFPTNRKSRPRLSFEDIKMQISLVSENHVLLDVRRDKGYIEVYVKCPDPDHNPYWTSYSVFRDATSKRLGCQLCFGKVAKKVYSRYTSLEVEKILDERDMEFIEKPTTEWFSGYIDYRCKICGHISRARPIHLLNGRGCKNCLGFLRKTTEEFKRFVSHTDGEYEVLGQYTSANTPILMKHKVCGHEYMVRPLNFQNGKRCPRCIFSRGEDAIETWLSNNNINHTSQQEFEDCKDKRKLRFDFYLPTHNICIEYQGRQHYEEIEYFGGVKALKSLQKRDRIKKEYCKLNSIYLIEIPYWDFQNIQGILEEVIQNKKR